MNQDPLEVAAEQRLFDVMLDEVVHASAPARSGLHRGRWLAAAVALLGLAVVVGVVVTSRPSPAAAAVPQEPAPLPPLVTVRGTAELVKLDRKVENLSCAIEGPDLGPLQQFVSLRALRVEQDHDLPFATLVASAWSLAPIAGCTKLESLSVGYFARFTAVELQPIATLPNLRSLELVGREKDVDAAFAAVLGKLPLRSLVLHAVHILPEGLRALGELPLLERLELRDCTGLEACDLRHLYRLRQLRALSLRGVGMPRQVDGGPVAQGEPISIQLPEVRDGKFVVRIPAEWMRGLGNALPDLRELDLAECRLDDDVLEALPKKLTSFGIRGSLGYGERGVAAVAALPELQALRFGDPVAFPLRMDGEVAAGVWLPMLRQKPLQRIEFCGVLTADLTDALRQQTGLRELRFDLRVRWSFAIRGNGVAAGPPVEDQLPSLACLGGLRQLQRIELLAPSVALEQAVRSAVPAGVRVEVVPRR